MWIWIFIGGMIVGCGFGIMLMACISIDRINSECHRRTDYK